ncbi:MAG: zinc ABC transporter substrate-binding protein [Pseudazoarcus pumilus]|nr:zinc ABC transporter substrate-binding protein [Pseudazoarcus pumilus]
MKYLLACLLFVLGPSLHAAPLKVVASFSILADMAREIGGERVTVTALVGHDADAHAWQPRPSDARTVMEADVLIANGLGFDTWMERLAASAGKREVVLAAEGVKPLEQHDDHSHAGHDHGPIDPHAWQSVANVRIYARNIASALIAGDATGEAHYRERLARYDAALAALDADIRQAFAALPEEARKVVTSHDAFAYFGASYGVRFLSAAGVGNRSEVSAAAMARLIRQLRKEKVPVVFIENINDPRLIERIANEGGARMGGTLYSDALSGPDGPAASYLAMMRHNADTLLAGIRP